jgi:hypothetical protein
LLSCSQRARPARGADDRPVIRTAPAARTLVSGFAIGGFTASAFVLSAGPAAQIVPAAATPDGAVNICGSLVRWSSDGRTETARLVAAGITTEYRYALSYGTASSDLGAANHSPFLIRITGRQVTGDGASQAVELVSASVTRVSSCYERINAAP